MTSKRILADILTRRKPLVIITLASSESSTSNHWRRLLFPLPSFSPPLKLLNRDKTECEPSQALGNRGQYIAQIVCSKIDTAKTNQQDQKCGQGHCQRPPTPLANAPYYQRAQRAIENCGHHCMPAGKAVGCQRQQWIVEVGPGTLKQTLQ